MVPEVRKCSNFHHFFIGVSARFPLPWTFTSPISIPNIEFSSFNICNEIFLFFILCSSKLWVGRSKLSLFYKKYLAIWFSLDPFNVNLATLHGAIILAESGPVVWAYCVLGVACGQVYRWAGQPIAQVAEVVHRVYAYFPPSVV